MFLRLRLICALAMYFVIVAATAAVPGESGANIYKISIRSQIEVEATTRLGVNVFMRVTDGYLVHTIPEMEPALREAGIMFELVAVDIVRSRLALDIRHDRSVDLSYPIIYEDNDLRLYYVDPDVFNQPAGQSGITAILSDNIPITCRITPTLDLSGMRDMVDLETLAATALADSCESYVLRLQDFQTRWVGTDSNYASRDWLIDKFGEFGYDSIVTDTFMAFILYTALDTTTCHNVIAYKIGTTYPDHHIVVGAHRDAFPEESPGADDNGSGTAGVLEIARILSDIDTKMTIVFALFDAEETGMFGSWIYARRASFDGENIVLMINMDVIGYDENTDTAAVLYNEGSPYGELWQNLADSLSSINLGSVTSLDAYSGAVWDAQPFDAFGYPAMTATEYLFNDNLHSARDSAVYLDFDYMTRIVRACLVTAFVVDDTYVPAPILKFCYPNGLPDYLTPNAEVSFDVAITGIAGGTIALGTEFLHYAVNDGAYDVSQLSNLGGGLYQATIPELPCNSRVSYYVSVEESGGVEFYSVDPQVPHMTGTGLEKTIVAHYDFNDYSGWSCYGTANQGHWSPWLQRGFGQTWETPIDFDGTWWCFVTGPEPEPWTLDNFDVDDGIAIARSPQLDMAGGQVLLEYARWYSNHAGDAPYSDIFEVKISNDNGASWTTVETVGPVEQSSGGWFSHRLWINDYVEPNDQMRLRFDASDYGDDSNIEAGIDAVKVILFSCGSPVEITTTEVPDWTQNHSFSQQLEVVGGYGTISWADQNNDLAGTGLTLSSDGLISGNPHIAGLILFTVVATDALAQWDEQEYAFTINPAIDITTTSLPDGTIGEYYAYQLTAIGGTGTPAWTDYEGDLAGTGLELSIDGLLFGTPSDTGTIGFIAHITDSIGAEAQKSFELLTNVAYICGDANSDGTANVGDAVFMINYVFKGGPAPEC